MNETSQPPARIVPAARLTVRAFLLGERIDTAGLERSDVVSTTPLAFRVGRDGYVVVFRFGVAVLVGLSPIEEDEVLRGLRPRVIGRFEPTEEESATIEIVPDRDEQVAPGGPISVHDLSPPRLVVIADALAKNVALARDEREVSKVFDTIEPFAAELARSGRSPSNRRQMLRTDRPGVAGPSPDVGTRRGGGEAGRPVGQSAARTPLRPARRRVRAQGTGCRAFRANCG